RAYVSLRVVARAVPQRSSAGGAIHRTSTFRVPLRKLVLPIRLEKDRAWRFEFQARARLVRSPHPWLFATHRAPDPPPVDCAMLRHKDRLRTRKSLAARSHSNAR